jgi:hypothetical protein
VHGEVEGQEVPGALPGAGRGPGLVEHGRLPVVEGVPGVLLDVDLGVLAAAYGFLHPRHRLARYVGVAPAEVELDRRADPDERVGVIGDRRTVERDHGVDLGPGGEEVGDRPAEAEPDDAEPALDFRQRGEVSQREFRVVHASFGVEARRHLQGLRQALLVVPGPVAGLDPPEQVGGRDDVAEGGEIPSDGMDVVPHAVDLLDQQDAGTVPGLGQPDRQVERPVGRADLLDACGHGNSFRVPG